MTGYTCSWIACDVCDQSYPEDMGAARTQGEARMLARSFGWLRRSGKDYCGRECLAAAQSAGSEDGR